MEEDDQSTIIGFKEVGVKVSVSSMFFSKCISFEKMITNHGYLYAHYTKGNIVNFLVQNFPCSRYIFNIRSNETVLKSSHEKHFGKKELGQYEFVPLYYKKLLKILGSKRVYLMDMDEWAMIAKNNNGSMYFTKLSEWLGFKDCMYESVRHDNKDGYKTDKEDLNLGDHCRLDD